MGLVATGNSALLAVLMDQPQKDSTGFIDTVGMPLSEEKILAAPSAPSVAAGASGAITATRYWKISEVINSMAETAASTATAGTALAAEQGALTSIPAPSDSRVIQTRIYASDDGTLYGYVGMITRYRSSGEITSSVTGLEDATWGGTYTGAGSDGFFEVEIMTAATPDTFRWRKNGGSWTSGVAITGSAQTLSDGVTITFAATTGHTVGDVFKYGARSTKFNDNVATPDYTRRPLSASEVAANHGFRGFNPNSVTMMPDQKQEESAEITGYVGKGRSYPGLKSFEFAQAHDLRPGLNAFLGIHQLGEPDSITAIDGTEVFKYVTSPSTAISKPRSFTPLIWEGSPSIRPEMFPGVLVETRTYKFEEGKLHSVEIKLKGTRHSLVGFGTEGTAGTYADNRAPVVVGVLRSDIVSFDVNVTTAPTGGTFKIKCRVNGNAYGSTETTIPYDTGAGNIQKAGTGAPSAWVELVDENGVALGADTGENREPVLIYFPGDCSTLSSNDDWNWLAAGMLIPAVGTGSSPYSGKALRKERESRLAAPHFQFLHDPYGETIATDTSTIAKILDGSLEIDFPLEPVRELDSEAKTPKSYDKTAALGWRFEGTRRYDSRVYQEYVHRDERRGAKLSLLGAPVPNVIPGSVPTSYRSGTIWDVPQFAFSETPKRTVSGRGIITETIVGEAEKSDVDGEDIFIETTYSRRLWLPSGMSLTNASA